MTTGKTIALTRRTFVGQVMSLLFNMLSRLVITFLPRSKRLLISWMQLPSAVIDEWLFVRWYLEELNNIKTFPSHEQGNKLREIIVFIYFKICLFKAFLFLLFPHLFPMKWWNQMPWSSFSECWALSQLFHSPLSLSSRGFLARLIKKQGIIDKLKQTTQKYKGS